MLLFLAKQDQTKLTETEIHKKFIFTIKLKVTFSIIIPKNSEPRDLKIDTNKSADFTNKGLLSISNPSPSALELQELMAWKVYLHL